MRKKNNHIMTLKDNHVNQMPHGKLEVIYCDG